MATSKQAKAEIQLCVDKYGFYGTLKVMAEILLEYEPNQPKLKKYYQSKACELKNFFNIHIQKRENK